MPIKFPGAVDDLQSVTTSPSQVPLSSADVAGGPAPRDHVSHHRDIGSAIAALETMAIGHGHDHSGDPASVTPGNHRGVKLKAANTHESPDTDKSEASLHHTLGDGEFQAAPGQRTRNLISSAQSVANDALAAATTSAAFQIAADEDGVKAVATALNQVSSTAQSLVFSAGNGRLYLAQGGSYSEVTSTPIGAIEAFAGSNPPSGWLICDGKTISKDTYPELFAVIGYTYGGSGYAFQVPNLRGQVVVGYKSDDSGFNSLGKTGGEKTHRLTEAEMPSHKHPVTAGKNMSTLGVWFTNVAAGSGWQSISGAADNDGNRGIVTTSNTGGNGDHNNLQPYTVLNYIIRIK